MAPPAFWLDLADALTLVGWAGVIIASASALIAAIAFGVGNPDTGGIATAGWLVGVVLSLCGGFAAHWLLVALSLGSLPAFLLLAGTLAIVRAALPAHTGRTTTLSSPFTMQERTDA